MAGTITYQTINADGTLTTHTDPVSDDVSNRQDIAAKAQAALDANATYLALGSPTAAQTTAQVKLLTRECNALIRLCLQQFDTTTGT